MLHKEPHTCVSTTHYGVCVITNCICMYCLRFQIYQHIFINHNGLNLCCCSSPGLLDNSFAVIAPCHSMPWLHRYYVTTDIAKLRSQNSMILLLTFDFVHHYLSGLLQYSHSHLKVMDDMSQIF